MSLQGMSAATGEPLAGDAHLRQSIADILFTPIGSRVGRRDYGSTLPLLIDQPMNALGRLRLYAATATALARWEPRFILKQLGITISPTGATELSLSGERREPTGNKSDVHLLIPLLSASKGNPL